jgi:iron complex outermembrane receptor protein
VTVLPVSGSESYTNVLPGAQLSVELEPGFFVRMGAAQTMVRPRLDQERINQEFSVNPANVGLGSDPQYSPFRSNGGNIALRPYQSTNIDLSFEKYFSGGGYLALSGYFKNLTDFVDPNNNIAYDFSAALSTLPPAQQAIVQQQGSYIGLLKAPANTGKGTILGAEATASLPFKLFTPALDGFGIFASGSYTFSEVKYGSNPTEAATLPGLSKWVASGTAYFEKYGFQARVSYRYRSSFLGEVAGLSAAPTFRTAKAESIVDAQIGYEFQSGPLAGLSILLQGKNLTDQPFVTYQNDDPRQVIDYQRYGRDFYLGLSYKF